MKRLKILKILAACLILCMCISLSACGGKNGYAYVAIDINPSIELIVKDGKVADVTPLDEEASILLSGESIVGCSVEDATEKIVVLAKELGYLNSENNKVNITVSADSSKLKRNIEASAKKGVEKVGEMAEAVIEASQDDIDAVEKLKEENPKLYKNLTPESYKLISRIKEMDSSITNEALAEMSVDELTKKLNDLNKERDALISEETRAEMEERYTKIKEQTKEKVAKLYEKAKEEGKELITRLDDMYDEFMENTEDERELTKEELKKIKDAVGEKFEGVTVEDFKNFVSEQKTNISEKLVLTEEQKEELDKIKSEMKDSAKKVKDEIKEKFEDVKDYFDKLFD